MQYPFKPGNIIFSMDLSDFTGEKKEVKPLPKAAPRLEPWTKKYSPQKPEDLVGSEKSFARIIDYVENYSTQKKKALLIWGPSGTGKSCCAEALFDYEIVELNASDSRTKKSIEEKLGNAFIPKKFICFQEDYFD